MEFHMSDTTEQKPDEPDDEHQLWRDDERDEHGDRGSGGAGAVARRAIAAALAVTRAPGRGSGARHAGRWTPPTSCRSSGGAEAAAVTSTPSAGMTAAGLTSSHRRYQLGGRLSATRSARWSRWISPATSAGRRGGAARRARTVAPPRPPPGSPEAAAA